MPTDDPPTLNDTVPVGIPAPGATVATVAVIRPAPITTVVVVEARATATVRVAEPASYDALPACSARTAHVPAWTKVAVVPVSAQPPVAESTTGLPESPPAGGDGPRLADHGACGRGGRERHGLRVPDRWLRRRRERRAVDGAAPQGVTVGVTVVGPQHLLQAVDAARLRGDRETLVVEVRHPDRTVEGGVDHEGAGAIDLQQRGPTVVGVVGDGPDPLELGVEVDVGQVLEAAVDGGDLVRGGAVVVESEGDQVAGVLDRHEVQPRAVAGVGRRAYAAPVLWSLKPFAVR